MSAQPFDLFVGTTNQAKGRELVRLLSPHSFRVRTLCDVSELREVVEDGRTFAENARKKAIEYARQLSAWVLADDSGLEVAALDGRPGVFSARFAGEHASDEQNNQRLLRELGDLPAARRNARYWCHVAAADPTGQVRAESYGVCHGQIRRQPAGARGFGYDPLFEIREFHQTFGELGPLVKAALSHRGRAMRAIVPRLLALTPEWQSIGASSSLAP